MNKKETFEKKAEILKKMLEQETIEDMVEVMKEEQDNNPEIIEKELKPIDENKL